MKRDTICVPVPVENLEALRGLVAGTPVTTQADLTALRQIVDNYLRGMLAGPRRLDAMAQPETI